MFLYDVRVRSDTNLYWNEGIELQHEKTMLTQSVKNCKHNKVKNDQRIPLM